MDQNQVYFEHLKQAWADIQSGSDHYDKNILTLSSGGLGLSRLIYFTNPNGGSL